jgi:gas vesicle protein
MLWRKSKTRRAKRAATGRRLPSGEEVREQVREQVTDIADDLGEALETAKDAITRAMSSAGRRSGEARAEATRKTAELGKEVGTKAAVVGSEVGKKARRRARGVAHEAVNRLPEPEQVAEVTRRATEKLFPERAKQYRQTQRKRTRRRVYGAGVLAGLGMLVGWLTAPRKGDEVRQALKERANAASEKVSEMRSGSATDTAAQPGAGLSGPTSTGTSEPQQAQADVTPIHQGDGATASKRT